ncbi:serine hydrolase domain-containing protein [Henriciella sp. AS95]|uniref:serine hydrolase domain-containing protein n=1 Tax=Henriciella sp. AS95 TaxID=3135782 RepID=UPI00316C359F
MKTLSLVLCALFLTIQSAVAQDVDQEWLQSAVDDVRSEFDLIALGASVARLDQPAVTAVSGHTRKGSDEAVDPGDAWHIGSNTKALTALLYARLVEGGDAQWGVSVTDLFKDQIDTIDPAWNNVTIEDVFAHRAGVGQLGPTWLISRHADSRPVTEQRLETVEKLLASPPKKPVGEFEYSNLNYIVAGTAIELMTGESWEDAMKARVFDVPGSEWSEGWGFGPPQDGLQGTKRNLFGLKQAAGTGPGADNPAALGPAGTAHAPLESHARLLLEFINPESDLVTKDMREHLFQPWPDETADYAMGWGVMRGDDGNVSYGHAGSNTMWLSRALILPGLDAAIVVNTNEFNDDSKAATDAVLQRIRLELAAD